MRRRSLAVLVLCLAGCQDYNFNPVGRCVIQAASVSAPLANISVADVLFVVDDSGSMAPQQASLAANFQAFIDELTRAQADRKSKGLEPFEFHIAITSSSIFEAWQASGAPKCGTPSASTCSIQNPTFSWQPAYTYQCTTPGLDCPDLIPQYHNTNGCILGVGADKAPYPAGDFVAAAGNPRVLHFTKDLFDGSAASATKLQTLVSQFQKNIAVGTCGSGMEQHLEAGHLAVQKAIAGTQPGLAAGEWPHTAAKMVVVWVGDEDDCSNPKTNPPDPTKTLYFTPAKQSPGNDVCTDEALITDPARSRLFKIADYADYFTGLGRPFSAAFIYSAVNCRDDASGNRICDAGTCSCADFCPAGCGSCGPTAAGQCNIPAECSGKSNGTRIHDLSAQLRGKQITTIEATICDLNFAGPLQRIAQLVTEPSIPKLPTQPAASEVVQVRIQTANQQSSRPCAGPPLEDTDAARQAADWWFVGYSEQTNSCDNSKPPKFSLQPTPCLILNPNRAGCIANPGETYIAQYIGVLPEANQPAQGQLAGCADRQECATRLSIADPSKVACEIPAGQTRGSCVCVQ